LVRSPTSTATQHTVSSTCQAVAEDRRLLAARSFFSRDRSGRNASAGRQDVRPHSFLLAVMHWPDLQQPLQVGEARLDFMELPYAANELTAQPLPDGRGSLAESRL